MRTGAGVHGRAARSSGITESGGVECVSAHARCLLPTGRTHGVHVRGWMGERERLDERREQLRLAWTQADAACGMTRTFALGFLVSSCPQLVPSAPAPASSRQNSPACATTPRQS